MQNLVIQYFICRIRCQVRPLKFSGNKNVAIVISSVLRQ